MLHGHGDDWYKYKQPIRYNFSSNVYHQGTPKALLEAMHNSISSIGRYPSPEAAELAAIASDFHKLPAEYCLFTNGATEAFYLIAQLFRNRSASIFTPTFAEYEDACQRQDIETHFIPLTNFGAAPVKSALAFVCNPNNPNGFVTPLAILEMQISQYPETTFVIDEAYIDFVSGADSCIALIQRYPNLIVVKSLTKLFCIPGIRLGYMLSSPDLINQMKKIKMPWSVNSVAIAAGNFIFQHYEELKPDLATSLQESKELQKQIGLLVGFSVIPANTTFFLFKSDKKTAAELKDLLMQEFQILVRDATNFKGLVGEYVRVASQCREGNKLLIEALKEWNRK